VKRLNGKKKLFNVNESVIVVVYIGQLIEEKGLLVYLGAMKKLLKKS